MIGLMRGLAAQAYRETFPASDLWRQWLEKENFGLFPVDEMSARVSSIRERPSQRRFDFSNLLRRVR